MKRLVFSLSVLLLGIFLGVFAERRKGDVKNLLGVFTERRTGDVIGDVKNLSSDDLEVEVVKCNAANSCRSFAYKHLDKKDGGGGTRTKLYLDVFTPQQPINKNLSASKVITLLPGGGWRSHAREQFYSLCKEISLQGDICISSEYRTSLTDNTSPLHALEDVHDTLKFICKNTSLLGIESANSIVLGGSSAGGHLAAAAVLSSFPEYNIEPVQVDGIVLLNPVVDNSRSGYSHERVKYFYPELSPMHSSLLNDFARQSILLPPMLYIVGDNDEHMPLEVNKIFFEKWLNKQEIQNSSKIIVIENQAHGVLAGKYDLVSRSILDFLGDVVADNKGVLGNTKTCKNLF